MRRQADGECKGGGRSGDWFSRRVRSGPAMRTVRSPARGEKATSPAEAGEVEVRSTEGEGDRVAPQPQLSLPPATDPIQRIRAAGPAITWPRCVSVEQRVRGRSGRPGRGG